MKLSGSHYTSRVSTTKQIGSVVNVLASHLYVSCFIAPSENQSF